MIVLIAGSRNATPEMLDYAKQCVRSANNRGWRLICGDAPGVDNAVVEEANRVNAPVICYGVQQVPRCTIPCNPRSMYVDLSLLKLPSGEKNSHLCKTYEQRDDFMIQVAHIGIFIWNGKSNGTKRAYDAMCKIGYNERLKLGKPTYLYQF